MDKKTVLITGCSSGFGKLTAKTFYANGWNVIATMRSPAGETELTELDDVLVARLDVTDPESVQQAVDEGIARFGAIDVLVNNAGFGGHALFEQYPAETVRAMYDTNVFGLMNVTRAVLPHMRRQHDGCVINIDIRVRTSRHADLVDLLLDQVGSGGPDRGIGLRVRSCEHPLQDGGSGRVSDDSVRRECRQSAGCGRRAGGHAREAAAGAGPGDQPAAG